MKNAVSFGDKNAGFENLSSLLLLSVYSTRQAIAQYIGLFNSVQLIGIVTIIIII